MVGKVYPSLEVFKSITKKSHCAKNPLLNIEQNSAPAVGFQGLIPYKFYGNAVVVLLITFINIKMCGYQSQKMH